MSNILIVESKNDKIFLEALIKHFNYKIEVDRPIFINDYECLGSDNKTKLTKTLKKLKIDALQKDKEIEKIGLILDIDNSSVSERLEIVNQCLKEAFDYLEIPTLEKTAEMIKISIPDDDLEIDFACYFMNIDGQGELETVLKTIKTKDSTHANCLEDWKKCIINQGYAITDKDFDKFWISIYLRYDTCSNSEKRQAGKKCSMSGLDYIMENKSDIWDFNHPILDDLKTFLNLFETIKQ
ncbi:hypothetical protein PCC8801_0702 [Rippkaea orientalis PCC 8801]|uniref:DUF4435 domain-containing protein n=1 Tax=Rippkaea orientalis (strain PCC 8801 / RF-1) TaxID=41431 RepID=B7JXN0_RIPO1|nr:DUF3226 domain-containing protein [Rippkaea orientalis]ACK64787.1 hypothetical protein PCC8801_0702 [Rippkaea orientalis PCC 8801]